eukprot:TRINITY_DN25854_c0_g1_i1.p1 TRINITY_DN25854_c0_g1~~TRINITY_DN25854_c0_g1_i1.p1  ORF type:complete len:336 (-),score=56.63 TRINITY_DN25854_c0_g1_i1:358-1365(-)
MVGEPDALDQKGNCYYRRRLLSKTFLQEDLMKLIFELPQDVSLKSLGFDVGLGDFVRVRPYLAEHAKLVENPTGGRAYSPVLEPDTHGKLGLIVRAYGPGGVSSLLQQIPVGSEMLVTNHVEHVFWKERQKGYFANERNSAPVANSKSLSVCLVAFGIGITEIAPVAMSELQDPSVCKVTVLWALKKFKDAEWVWDELCDEQPGDLVHQFFAKQKDGLYGDKLEIKYVLSQEQREGCFHGRIRQDVLTKAFMVDHLSKASLRFLAVGTTAMIKCAYETLAQMGLDITEQENWCGENLLYRKLSKESPVSARTPSPLIDSHCVEVHEPAPKKARHG